MDNVRTVSDTKRDFYSQYTRPINSIYRRVVEELLVEMHLLSVNVDFRYDPIYGLGVVTSYEKFMAGYQPEQDKEKIFEALCQSVGGNATQYKNEANGLLTLTQQWSGEEFMDWLQAPTPKDGAELLADTVQAIAGNEKYKYSRLFAIGLYTLVAEASPELIKDDEKRGAALKQLAETLHLPAEKMQKDLDVFRGNLQKMEQLLKVMAEALEADRKKREKAAAEKANPGDGDTTEESATPDPTPSDN